MKSLFLIIGAPGSGKTTYAQIISEKNSDIAHYSTGELLRAEVASKSKLGEIIKKRIDAGELVPVEVALDTIKKAIHNSKCSTIIIDGYPRSIEQMMGLEHALKNESNIMLQSVIEVVVSEKTAMERVLRRNRGEDDSIEVFKNRMKVYNEPLKEIQNFYISKNLLHKISGEEEIELVAEKLNHLFFKK